jgi:hypothetical protein
MLAFTSSLQTMMDSSWDASRLARCLTESSRCLQARQALLLPPLPLHSPLLLLSRAGQQQAGA